MCHARNSSLIPVRNAALTAALALLLTAGSAAAIEVRHFEGARYNADLTRAYEQCTVSNTNTFTGIPACSPAVTSACGFSSASVDLRKREDTTEIDLDVKVNHVTGPGSCLTGPYTLALTLRVTADDATCTSGECTLVDSTISLNLPPHLSHDFQLLNFTLESALLESLPLANYQILGAVVMAPDGLPMAGAGTGKSGADVFAAMSTAYAGCGAPDTTGTNGVPACSAPVWESACDFHAAQLNMRRSTTGTSFEVVSSGLIGAPASCANGPYTIAPVMRITTDQCANPPCTLVDLAAPLNATAERGELEGKILLSSIGGLDLNPDQDNVELMGVNLIDFAGNLLAGVAVTPTLRLDRVHVRGNFRDPGNLTDDKLTLEARFPHPPFDPTVGGVTFTVTDKNGLVYAVTIPASAWKVTTPAKRWRYVDPTGTLNGVLRATINEFRIGGTPTGFKIRLVAANIGLATADLPAVNLRIDASRTGGGNSLATRNAVCKLDAHHIACK